ncbi:MAG: penicillin-binding protein activator LpoB [Kiritimatiellae bacterium]|jgi:uncharacterized protein (TIGR02722 family)|nr:penicillin-binding protein activator LpoB [Kiritimatiellia bacterium]
MRKISLSLAMVAVVGSMMVGCSSTIKYDDPASTRNLETSFGASDLQQVANTMVDSMLVFPPMVAVTSQRRPVITVSTVKNKTDQHIDTESITDSIRTKLIRSGKFRFIDRTTDDAAVEELKIQNDSGLVDPKTAQKFGKQIGAEYILTSNLSQITQSAGRQTDVYYKFTMSLKNLETGILEWSDEKELRKLKTKSMFGM